MPRHRGLITFICIYLLAVSAVYAEELAVEVDSYRFSGVLRSMTPDGVAVQGQSPSGNELTLEFSSQFDSLPGGLAVGDQVTVDFTVDQGSNYVLKMLQPAKEGRVDRLPEMGQSEPRRVAQEPPASPGVEAEKGSADSEKSEDAPDEPEEKATDPEKTSEPEQPAPEGEKKSEEKSDEEQPEETEAPAPAPAPSSDPGDSPESRLPRIVNIEVEGNKNVPDEEILQVVSTRIGDPLLEPRIRRDMQAIFDLGYFTDVRLDTPVAPGGLRLVFRVLENPMVNEIRLEGNEVVEDTTLLGIMETKAGKILNTRTVHSDIQAINRHYNEEVGYLLTPTHVTDLTFENGVLTLSLKDGITVTEVRVEGVSVYDNARVAQLVRVKPGDLFNRKHLDEDQAKIAELYEKDQWVLETVAPSVDPETGVVVVNVLEAVVEEIRVEGNVKTTTNTVLRNLRTKPGQVLNRRKFQKDLERLNNLGYFKKVDPSPQPGTDQGKLILVLDVVEQKTGLATIGIGYAGGGAGGVRAGVTGALSFSDRNLFGRGKSASAQWQRGAQISSIGLSFFDPAINGNQDSIGLSLFRNEVDGLRQPVLVNGQQEFAFYDDERTGGSLTYGHPLTDDLRIFGTVRHETIEILQDSGSFFTPVGLGSGNLNSLGFSALYDTRDDIFNPHVGSFANGAVNVAGFGGTFNFEKYTLEGRHYIPIGDNHTIALRGWLGYLSGDAPITEFFYAGGPDTLRGYQQNQFFGTRFLVANAEYRFPIGNIKFLRGAVFVDAGNAYTPGGLFDDKIFLDAGLGLRITFPALGLGVIRVDYAWGEDGGRTQIGIGQSF